VTVGGLGSDRARLLGAVVDEVAERGYEAAALDRICERAGVPEALFKELFGDKHTCFLAACQALADDLMADVASSVHCAANWRESVHAGVGAFLGYLADHPRAASACMVEGLAAGPEALEIRDRTLRSFATLLEALQEFAPTIPDPHSLRSELTVGGIYETAMTRIRNQESSTLPDLEPSLSHFLLAAAVGHDSA
jgi:AcrR family transcriptional regulator